MIGTPLAVSKRQVHGHCGRVRVDGAQLSHASPESEPIPAGIGSQHVKERLWKRLLLPSAATVAKRQGRQRRLPKGCTTKQKARHSLKNDLDALVNRAPSLSDDELTQAHRQLLAKFTSVRYAAKGIADQATRQLNRGMETTTEYVKDRPMQSVAVAVGTGLLLGMLFKRR